MKRVFYHDVRLEERFQEQICTLARHSDAAQRRERLLRELQQVFRHEKGTLFALVSGLVEYSLALGYPLSFRGRVGSLSLAHAIGLAQNDPETLGLHQVEPSKNTRAQIPHISLNAAHAVYPALMDCLTQLTPDCRILQGIPGQQPYRVFLLPAGYSYHPEEYYLALDIYCHALMDQTGEAVRTAHCIPDRQEIFDPDFLSEVWWEDLDSTIVLRDLCAVRARAPYSEPQSLEDYITALRLALGPEEQLERLMDEKEALFEPDESILCAVPRCQLAEYLTYALTLVWLRRYG